MKPLHEITEYDRAYPVMADDGTELFVLKVRADGDDRYLAFSNVCTHMGCTLLKESPGEDGVPLRRDRSGSLVCGPCRCHGTSFDLSRQGIVVLGPATQHLPEMKLDTRGGTAASDGWVREAPAANTPWPALGGGAPA